MQDHLDIYKYVEYISNLPQIDNPSLFGLHSSADTNFRNIETRDLLESVMAIQPKETGSAGGETPEQFVLNKVNE
jgi:dynein heavy chain